MNLYFYICGKNTKRIKAACMKLVEWTVKGCTFKLHCTYM